MKAKRYYSLDQYNLGQRTVILALLLGIILGAFLGFLRNQSRSRSLQGQEQLASEVVVARQALSRVNARLSMLKDAFLDSHDNKEDAYALLEAMERRLEGGGGGEIAGLIGSDSRVSKAAGVVNSQPISTVGVSEMLSRVVGDSSLANLPVVNDDSPLSKKLKEVAINNEILVAVSNKNLAAPGFMLDMWIKSCQASGVKNYMVICLDDETERFVRSQNAPAYNMKDVIPTNHGTHNHAVSALKFRILERCLKLGYSVLMSDVDILVFEDPFKHLVRDSDIESMSDGFNEQTAYGYNDVFDDPSMGWSRYAHTMRIFVFNSGLFYVKATQGGLRAMVATAEWLETKGGWDQAVFNEVIQFPSSIHRGVSPNSTRRVMDIYKFVNSKTFFCFMRKASNFKRRSRPVKPVMIHVNYHPDKFERLKAIRAFYQEGVDGALDKFPCGEKHEKKG